MALAVAMPVFVTALVAPVVARIVSEPAVSPAPQATLDITTINAVLAAASQPVEAELDRPVLVPVVSSPTTSTTTTAAPTTTTTEAPSVEGNRGTFALPPGAKLPSDKDCSKAVKKSKETRPENKGANKTKVNRPTLGANWGSNPKAAAMMSRVNGNYSGTTDEIVQWASCKWGIEADTVRAQMVIESNWRQSATAAVVPDQMLCPPGMTAPCPRAFGVLQLRNDSHPGTYPASAMSTAYNLDYGLAMKRACYDGVSWLGEQTRGDAWGCVGMHYSGRWYDDGAKQYIAKVQGVYKQKSWPH